MRVCVQGNEVADRLAGNAVVGDRIRMDKLDVLRDLSASLREEEEREWKDNHHIVRMKEIGVRKGEGRKCQRRRKSKKTSQSIYNRNHQ